MPTNRLSKQVFTWEVSTTNNSWFKSFSKVCELIQYKIPGVECTINIKTFEQKCHEYYNTRWKNNVCNNQKLTIYKEIKQRFETTNYIKLNLDRPLRSILCRLLSGTLKLHMETGRYKKIPRAERLCNICDLNLLEDEIHFVFVCPRYVVPRKLLFDKVESIETDFEELSYTQKLRILTEKYCKLFAKYLTDGWKLRQCCIYKSTSQNLGHYCFYCVIIYM